jgi:ABC-type polysaccharide transport system permease subunit
VKKNKLLLVQHPPDSIFFFIITFIPLLEILLVFGVFRFQQGCGASRIIVAEPVRCGSDSSDPDSSNKLG